MILLAFSIFGPIFYLVDFMFFFISVKFHLCLSIFTKELSVYCLYELSKWCSMSLVPLQPSLFDRMKMFRFPCKTKDKNHFARWALV